MTVTNVVGDSADDAVDNLLVAAAPGTAEQSGAAIASTSDQPPAPTNRGRTVMRRLALTLAGLVAAWLLPVAAHALRVDWLMLLLVIVGTAAVMRRGGDLMNRLVLVFVTLGGVTCGAAVLFSVWPWHLSTVALAGIALSLLVLLCGVLGRTPSLPRLGKADALVAVPVAVLAFLLYYPMLRRPLSDRIGLLMISEDQQRHFMMWDTTRRIGAYLFFDRYKSATSASVLDSDRGYPPGAHMIGAVLDNFVMSTTVPGEASAAFARFIWYDLAAYLFLFLTVVWGARRIAGSAAGFLSFFPIAALAGGYVMFGDLFPALIYGFAPQIVGMGFLVVVVALSARPLPSARQQIVVTSAAMVGVAFVYYLLLPLAAVAVLVHLVAYRRRLLRQWPVLLLAAAVSLPTMTVPRSQVTGDQTLNLILQPFGIVPVKIGAVLVLLLGYVIVLMARRRPWAPDLRVMSIAVGFAVLLTTVVGVVQLAHGGKLLYFFDKMLYCVILLALVALGAAVPVLNRMLAAFRSRGRAVVAAAAAVAIMAAATGAIDPRPTTELGNPVGWPTGKTSYGVAYLTGGLNGKMPGRAVIRIYDHTPDDGRVVLVSLGTDWDHSIMLKVAVLDRHAGASWYDNYFFMIYRPKPDDFVRHVTQYRGKFRYRIVTTDPVLLEKMRRLAHDQPDLGLDVVDYATLPQT